MATATAPPSSPPALPSPPPWSSGRYPPAPTNSRTRTMLALQRDPIGLMVGASRKLGPVFSLRIPPYQALLAAASPETNKEVLTDQKRFVGGRAASLLIPWIGAHSLIVAEGPTHLRNRKLLLPPFHGEHVKQWGERMRELATQELERLPEDKAVAIRPMAQRLALDVILKLVFGVKDEERMARFRTALDGLLNERITMLMFHPALHTDHGALTPGRLVEQRKAAVIELIEGEIAIRRSESEQRDDVLSIMLAATDEAGEPAFSEEELISELRGLVVAGHETTATALAWILHLLAHNPTIQAQLRESLEAGESDYLKAVIAESMRLRPPVFDAVRIAAEDTELAGVPIPAGSHVSALFTATHFDPEVWSEPLEFRPERHLSGGEADNAPPYSLTPFGGGIRRCLGASLAQLELEIASREFILNREILPAGEPELPRLHAVTLIPSKGGRVRLVRRPRER